ncbi:MAG TPA: hypothetical protein VIU45_09265 [Chitinophagaceae bacterium]
MWQRRSRTCSLLAGGLLCVFLSCKKENNFINEQALGRGAGYYPLSVNTLRDTTTQRLFTDTSFFSAGQTIAFELQYFSQDPIREVDLYATVPGGKKTQVSSQPFDASFFSYTKGADTTILTYTIPGDLKPGSIVRLDAVVLNENSLSLTRTIQLNTR